MWGWAKILEETAEHYLIAYSLNRDESLDGILEQDRKTGSFSIKKLSAMADEHDTMYFSGIVGTALLLGKLKNTITCIAS